ADLDFRPLGGLLEPLQGHAIAAEIDAVFFSELVRDPVHDTLIEVVTAEVGIAIGRLHLEDALTDFENRDVERSAAEVVDRDLFVVLLVETVGERGGRGLVDDALDLEAGDLAGVLGRLTLTVVEVGGHRDDGLRDRLAEVRLRGLLQLAQDHRRDLRRRVLLAADLDADIAVRRRHDFVGHLLDLVLDLVVAPAHEALDREDGVLGVGDGLPLGHLTDQDLAVLGEGDDRRCQPAAFLVGNHRGLAAFHYSDDRVRGAEVAADDFAHGVLVALACDLVLKYRRRPVSGRPETVSERLRPARRAAWPLARRRSGDRALHAAGDLRLRLHADDAVDLAAAFEHEQHRNA